MATMINGHALDKSSLATQFEPFYTSGQRIIVRFSYGENGAAPYHIKRGYVGKTTGWRPSYILMATVRSTGSSDLLRHDDVIIGTVERWRDN